LKKIIAWITQHHGWQRMVTLVVLGLAVYLILPEITELEDSWQVLTSMALWAVGLAFIAQVFSYLGSGFMLQSILAIVQQKVSLWLSFLIVLGSYSIGIVAGGTIGTTAAIYRWTNTGEGNMEGATLASIFLPQFNTIMLVLVSFFGLVPLILTRNLTQAQTIGFGATLLILGLIIGGVALAVRFRSQVTKPILWIARWVARLRRKPYDLKATQQGVSSLFDAWDALWLQGAWIRPAVGAFLNMAFDVLTLYFLFLAAGNNISLGVLLAGYGLPLLLGKVAFILPGGVGVVESSMAVLYHGLGVPSATAAVVVLGYRLISFWGPSLTGFPVAAYLENSVGRSHLLQRVHKDNE
jgi:glycosyltransferase 2 family protein